MDFVISRRQMLKLSAVLGTAALAGCGGSSEEAAAPADDAAASSDVKDLTFEPGKLTVATGNPAW